MEPKYPNITVPMAGEDGNAFSILGRCKKAARRADVPKREIDKFVMEAQREDYDHLVATVQKWFNVE